MQKKILLIVLSLGLSQFFHISEAKARPGNFIHTLTRYSPEGDKTMGVKMNNSYSSISPNCSITDSVAVVSPSCVGLSDGSATATPSSGAPPFTYSWSDGQTTSTATGLSAGTYTVTVTDASNCSITNTVTINQPPYTINTIIGHGAIGYSGDGKPSVLAGLLPLSTAISKSGDIYVVDVLSNRVRIVKPNGIISTFAGNGASGYSGDGGQATAAEFQGPTGVALDKLGNVYIADEKNNVVRKVNTSGIITTVAGNGTVGYGGDGGLATAAELDNPDAIALDGSGNLYISDYSNEEVRVVNTGGIINTFAGIGYPGYTGDGGQATAAEILGPLGIATDSKGNVYFADDTTHIRMVTVSTGKISTFAGTKFWGFTGDGGPATAAEMRFPWAVAIDTSDNVYVTDLKNARVRMIDKSGTINTIAGTGVGGYSGDGGTATAADINAVNFEGISVDDSYNLYLSEGFQGRVRKLYACQCAMTSSASLTKQPCYADSNGAAQVTVVSPVSPFNYFWLHTNFDTTSAISTLKQGAAEVFVKDANFCWSIDTVNANAYPKVVVSISGLDSICPGSSVNLTASVANPTSYLWSNGATSSIISVSPTSNQTYTVIATNTNSCKGDTTFALKVISFAPTITGPDSSCPGDIVVLTALGGTSFGWDNGATSASITVSPHADTTYRVLVSNGNCSDSVTHHIVVSTGASACSIKIYKGITPNGDGHNDTWVIDNIELYPNNSVQIFSRWGTEVWSATGYDNVKVVWTGDDSRGQHLPDATYYYIVKANNKTYKGWVLLTR